MASVFLFIPVLIVIYFLYQKYRSHKKLRDIIDKIPGPPAILVFGNTLQFKLDKVGTGEFVVRHRQKEIS